jgi:heterodisulfide reductase subunit A-like polyferredoxin
MLNLQRDTDGFVKLDDPYLSPFKTRIPGLFCAGGICGPKSIDETLNEARAVSLEMGNYLKKAMSFADQQGIAAEI